MALPDKPENISVDWHAYTKAALIFAVPLVCLEFELNAKSLLPFIVLVSGALWFAWGVWIIYQSRTSHNWPAVQGVIVENSISTIEAPLERHLIYYFPALTYRYVVNGVELVSSRIVLFPSDLRFPGGDATSFADASKPHHRDHLIALKKTQEFLTQFPLTSGVAVHYNPREPKDAVLIVGALSRSHQHSIVFLVLGSFLFYVEFWTR